MSKKIVAMLMAVAMAFSLLPVTAFATGKTNGPADETGSVTARQDGVNITKKVVPDGKGNYNLVMEAYVEGITTETTTSTPLDIVLVLDVSGSMDGPMGNRDKTKRIDALKNAVKGFITKVAENNPATAENPVGHRISIVKFAKNSDIVKHLTDVSTGESELNTAVDQLSTGGATRADLGMQQAKDELKKNSTDQSRDKVVVMFTDGSPNDYDGFGYDVASRAIANSAILKKNNVKVYTVGIFSGADSREITAKDWKTEWNVFDSNRNNKYMQAVSSNYPTASLTYGLSTHRWNPGQRADGNYYLTATDADGLNKVFQEISDSITHTTVTADENAVLRDTLTDQFVLNGTNASAITVKKAKVTDKNGDTYSWGIPENVDVEKAIDGKTVTVTGFNYTSEDNVITENNGKYSGHKLIVTIPIKVDEAYEGWKAGPKNYDTNTTGDNNKAGLTGYTKDGQAASTLLDESPKVPVTAYTVTYKYDKEYAGAPNLSKDTKAYLPGKSIKINGAPAWPNSGYTFDGWKLPNNLNEQDGSFSMPAWDVEITGSWTENHVTIHYVALDGGTITESTETGKKNHSEIVGLANPQARGATAKPNEGQYFVGWYSDKNCENPVSGEAHYSPAITSQQDATYYAKFSDKQTITIQVPDETLTYTGDNLTGKSYSDATISPGVSYRGN